MAKFGTFSSVGMFTTVRDGDGVDIGTRNNPCESIGNEDDLTSVEGGDDVGTTFEADRMK